MPNWGGKAADCVVYSGLYEVAMMLYEAVMMYDGEMIMLNEVLEWLFDTAMRH